MQGPDGDLGPQGSRGPSGAKVSAMTTFSCTEFEAQIEQNEIYLVRLCLQFRVRTARMDYQEYRERLERR